MGARPKQREGAKVGMLSWGAQSRSHGPLEELRALADMALSLHLLSPSWQGWEAASPRDFPRPQECGDSHVAGHARLAIPASVT